MPRCTRMQSTMAIYKENGFGGIVKFSFTCASFNTRHQGCFEFCKFAAIMIQPDQITSLDDRLDALRRHL